MRLRLGWILWVGIKRVKVKPQTLHTDSWIKTEQVDVTCFIISLFNAQHVLNVSISILRSLRLICWVISWVVLLWFDVCWCYGVVRLGWCGILMQAEALLQTYHYNGTLITEQNRGEQNPLFELAIETGLKSQLFHNKWIPTIRHTWISFNSTTKAGGSRSGYVKTIIWSH